MKAKSKTEAVETFIWELRRAFRTLTAAADEALTPLGIQAGDRALLEFLAREEQPISLSDLARKRRVSRQHIHQSLRRLPDPGWVTQIVGSDDRREVLLSLSAKGRTFRGEIRKIDHSFFTQLAPVLPRRDLDTAIRLLRRLQGELDFHRGGSNENER
jgi:DNA-binding MarR family transcriptional regulator